MASTSDRVAKCRAHADQCRAWADLSQRAEEKAEFMKLAAQWTLLAQEIETIESMRGFVTAAERQAELKKPS
jgi:hypothetical protein